MIDVLKFWLGKEIVDILFTIVIILMIAIAYAAYTIVGRVIKKRKRGNNEKN